MTLLLSTNKFFNQKIIIENQRRKEVKEQFLKDKENKHKQSQISKITSAKNIYKVRIDMVHSANFVVDLKIEAKMEEVKEDDDKKYFEGF